MDLCIECLNDLVWLGHSCDRCALPLPDPLVTRCGACAAGQGRVDAAVAALAYEFPVSYLIAALKYRRQQHLARVLAELLAIRLRELGAERQLIWPDLLVPVPLHWWREYRRGYNQAALLAQALGRELVLPVALRALRRTRATPPQTGLRRVQRQRNVRGAFRLGVAAEGLHVAIVDDVLTTGSTVQEVAGLLQRAGASHVSVWCVARAGG